MEHINGIKAAVVGVLGCLTALWGWFGWLVVAWVACMVLDYATGSFAALRAGEWSSVVPARDTSPLAAHSAKDRNAAPAPRPFARSCR